jgi:hypothetical protein
MDFARSVDRPDGTIGRVSEPTPLVAHRCLVWAGRADGNTYEISRALGETDLEDGELAVALTWTPVEARRLHTYLVGMGWHDVQTQKIALADLAEGRHALAAVSVGPADDRPQMRFAAPGGLTCRAVAAERPAGLE